MTHKPPQGIDAPCFHINLVKQVMSDAEKCTYAVNLILYRPKRLPPEDELLEGLEIMEFGDISIPNMIAFLKKRPSNGR